MLKNYILKVLSHNIITKNKRFVNLHDGDKCYIFGNGLSLKYYDLSLFKNRIGIGCGPLFSHYDFKKANIKYLYEGQPFFFYKYWKNPYSRSLFEKNLIGDFYKRKIKKTKGIEFFCSLSNFFGLNGENINYLHHYDAEFNGFKESSITSNFTTMKSALQAMIGMAINMGFSNIILVGCDYCMYPSTIGHFFEKGDLNSSLNFSKNYSYQEQFSDLHKINIEIQILTPNSNFSSNLFDTITYESLMNKKPMFSENEDLISKIDLDILNHSKMNYKIF